MGLDKKNVFCLCWIDVKAIVFQVSNDIFFLLLDLLPKHSIKLPLVQGLCRILKSNVAYESKNVPTLELEWAQVSVKLGPWTGLFL